jgi:hypothetical protein
LGMPALSTSRSEPREFMASKPRELTDFSPVEEAIEERMAAFDQAVASMLKAYANSSPTT